MFSKTEEQPSEVLTTFIALIDDFPDMIHSLDSQGNIVFVNRMASELLGYTKQELCGMNIRQLYPPEILEAVEQGFREVKATGEKRVESLLLAKDGTRIPVEIRTVLLRDSHQAFSQTFSISRDLRQLKEMQSHLIHAGRLAAIGELAAGAAHDLNNPLMAIGVASAMLTKLAENPDLPHEDLKHKTVHYCEKINGSASTMKHLTTRLRDFARGVKDQHEPVDLFDPIHDALLILEHRLRTDNIRVCCPIVKGKHWIRGDRNQIEQVFLNLTSNACDAMSKQETRELNIDIGTQTVDSTAHWICTVSDTGTGIPEKVQSAVFKSFFTTKPRGKGTGLGLSISRSIIAEHNGEIRLSSTPGKGTSFFLLLPVLPPPSSSSGAISPISEK